MSNWKNIWGEAKYAAQLLIRNKVDGEAYFEKMIQVYGNDAMIFYQRALAYENIGEKELALENFKIARNNFSMPRWKNWAQQGVDRIENTLSQEINSYYLTDEEIIKTEEYKLFFNLFKSSYVEIPLGGYYSTQYRFPSKLVSYMDIISEKLRLQDKSFLALWKILSNEIESSCFKHTNGLIWTIPEASYFRSPSMQILPFFEKASYAFSEYFTDIEETPEHIFHLAILLKAYTDVFIYRHEKDENASKIEKLTRNIEFILWECWSLKINSFKISAGKILEYEEIDSNNISIDDVCEAMKNVSSDFKQLSENGIYGTLEFTMEYKLWNPLESENSDTKEKPNTKNTANWHKIWRDSISANSSLKRSQYCGETQFKKLIEIYGEDGMIFFEWGLAYDTIGKKDLALEKFKIAKEKLPLDHWRKRVQYCIDKIERKSLEKYPHQIKAMCDLHSFLYSEKPQEQELKYLLISSLPNIETESASTLIYFRVALENFLDTIGKYKNIKLNYKLANDIDFICNKLNFPEKIKNIMHNIRKAGNSKVHSNSSIKEENLATDINGRIDDFMEIVKFYKSSDKWS